MSLPLKYYLFVRKKPHMVSNPFSACCFYVAFYHSSPYECCFILFVVSTLFTGRKIMFDFSELLNFV